MITNIDDAQHELGAMLQDARADYGDELSEDDAARDFIVSVCFEIEDDDLAREFCRRELGHVPYELRGRLGDQDWLES